ncbi:MAG: PilZ domain-containing protein [Spirochaetes bacterium]|nr:PilZ domain-containing protein [Spirochaetota bacterium]
MKTDNRIENRTPCWGIIAKIESHSLNQEAKVIDLSQGGACVDQKITPVNPANVILFKKTSQNFYRLKERKCQIVEHQNRPHTGIRFAEKLTKDEIDILGLFKI